MNGRLSVVIITWNSQRDVAPCLSSVCESVRRYDAEIILVDNGSTDDTRSLLQACAARGETPRLRFRFIFLDKNCGVAFARNAGLKAATGEYLWILDVDTVVNSEATDAMVAYIAAHPECGLCTCRLESEQGEIQDNCRRLPLPKYKIMNVLEGITAGMKRLREKIRAGNESQFYRRELSGGLPFEAEYVIGACQMFRRTMLEVAGLLDERIFYGPEDADYCLRISRKGYRVVCLPCVRIIHRYNRMSAKKLFSRISFRHMKGLIYFYRKHKLFKYG
jgi:GT2 family glycosyltransferase